MAEAECPSIVQALAAATTRRPGHTAVREASGPSVAYSELDALSDRVRDLLVARGIVKGDRVGIYLRKSVDAYAFLLGVLKAGAAYVPIDPAAPAWRSAFIAHDCGLRLLVLDRVLAPAWRSEAERLGPVPDVLELEGVGGGGPLRAALEAAGGGACPTAPTVPVRGPDLAYILYTSGSTGTPKGVRLTHACAMLHVDWCCSTFALGEDDCFSSHAPFHFDLSVTDLFVPLRLGATVVLFDADQGKEPVSLARSIAEHRISVWYSTPTTLMLLCEYGRLERHDLTCLRHVLFAGEVFPPKHLRALAARLPGARFFNLYGPTETNVCTWHPIPSPPEADRATPYPIGRPCSHFVARVVDPRGEDVPRGVEGELLVHGEGMLEGYHDRPEQTAAAFLSTPDGRRWYRTGDLVTEDPAGILTFVGRRDRMVKRRGFRIEMGEVEAGLHHHEDVLEAAAAASHPMGEAVRITAFVVLREGARRSEIALRAHCAKQLPHYMMPDNFRFLDALPRTPTGKVDYLQLTPADRCPPR